MKLGLPAKLAIVLLMASPFVYSDENHTLCTLVEGDETILPIHMDAFDCPATACMPSLSSPGIYCEVQPSASCMSLLSIDGKLRNREAWPMVFTANSCETPTPFPDAPIVPPPVPIAPPVEIVPTVPDDLNDQDLMNSLTNIQTELNNQRKLSQSSHDNMIAMSTAINANFSTSLIRGDQNKSQILNLMSMYHIESQNHRNSIRSMINGLSGYVDTRSDSIDGAIASARLSLSDSIATSYELLNADVDASAADLTQLLIDVQDVKNQVVAFGDSNRTTTTNAFNELSDQIADLSAGGGDGQLTVSLLGDISNTAQLQLGETMDGFQGVKAAVQNLQSQGNNNTDRIVNALNNSTGIASIETQLMQVNGKLGGLSGQLSQQLGDIQSAIENGGGTGGGDDDTATNEKLDGIKGALDGIADTSGFAQDLADGTAQGQSDLNGLLDSYDAQESFTDRFTQISEAADVAIASSAVKDLTTVEGVKSDYMQATSLAEIFAFSRANCGPIQFNGKSMNFCEAATNTSEILEYLIWALTAIFVFVYVSGILTNERLS